MQETPQELMKVTFLGTGTSQGVPAIACDCEVCHSSHIKDKRLRVSIHLEISGKSFIIDTGPDFRQQVLRENIKNLDAVLFTHEHRDHVAGLDDIRGFNFRLRKDMPLYATARVKKALEQTFAYIFKGAPYPGLPQVHFVEISKDKPFSIKGVKFIPIEVFHHKLPVLGFRVKDFTYITDAKYISSQEMEKVKGTKVLVLNALQKERHISHLNLQEALEWIEIIQPQQAYLTHIGHLLGKHAKVEKELPDHVHLAYDGLCLELKH